MRSLFLKIFLSFWLAQALFMGTAILLTLALRPSRGSWESLRNRSLADAVQAYEQGGQAGLRQYFDQLQASQNIRAFLFDAQGNELTGTPAPEWAYRASRGLGLRPPPFPWNLMPPRFLHQSVLTADGRRFTLAMELPPGPRVFFGPHGFPGMGLLIAIISSGLVCYSLTRYLTAPVVRLRTATQQIAAGNLSARAGVPPSHRRDELAELVRDFDAMAGRLQSLVTAQSRLLNDVSHELRSPLARLNVALGLARQRTGPEAQPNLDRIEREADRLNELIGRLLTIARLESGEDGSEKTAIALAELVRQVAEDADFEAQDRQCRVACTIERDAVVLGDESLLHSAIENVVRNATRYTREGTTVQVLLTTAPLAAPEHAVVQVSDSGPGVPPDALDKLFRPFYRLDDARNRQTGGVGLGLAITERTIRLHGGTVTASNRSDGGLLVEIRLPLAPDSAREGNSTAAKVPAAAAPQG